MYTMKEPISWQRFKSYPVDIQKEYLQWFVDEFRMSRGMFADMVGISGTGVYPYLKQQGLLSMLVKQPDDEHRLKFREWLRQYHPDKMVEEKPVEEPKKEKVKIVEQPMFFNTITGCEMNFEGKASEISQTLFTLFRDQKIAVNVVFLGSDEKIAEIEKQ